MYNRVLFLYKIEKLTLNGILIFTGKWFVLNLGLFWL